MVFTFIACSRSKFEKEWTTEKAPETFSARFETTKGNFEIEIRRSNSPAAADRLYQLISHGYYDNSVFYRVVPNYVAQFGNTDVAVMEQWRSVKIPDEPVRLGNKKGTISFARYGKETRDLELFINLNHNIRLDTTFVDGVKGYPALGQVSKGMEVVEELYSGYGERTMPEADNMYADRPDFMRTFVNLDVIRTAYILSEE